MATEALAIERSVAPTPLAAVAIDEARRMRVDLGGALVDQLDRSAAVEQIQGFLSSGTPHQIVTVNLDFLSIASRDERFRETINQADLAVHDGMPVVWLARLKGHALTERVTGVDLVDESCRLAAAAGRGVFLLGAAPGVADKAAAELVARHPGLLIAGIYSPPMGSLGLRENARIVEMINATAPGFLFVALGAPRQDLWIRDHLAQLGVPVAMGVGCALDLLAGSVTRAPSWMQRMGLEWAYRLGREPGRLWRRYLLKDLPMFGRLLLNTVIEEGADPMTATT
jgi:N-acetylglucosaminyldiphosphoundecaprenol N-acetyl-beta-D-mannosaminyltransferase